MLQDIAPKTFYNQYAHESAQDDDYIIIYAKEMIIFSLEMKIPRFCDLPNAWKIEKEGLIYLFSVDTKRYFLCLKHVCITDGFSAHGTYTMRTIEPMWLAFAASTAGHLAKWYEQNQFCGCCGAKTIHSDTERALICTMCDMIKYPSIAPCVIVGIIDGDRILMTKYSSSHHRYALVAGFVEIGETLEQCVMREVMEEVGIKVKNLKYYASQPWPFSGSLLMGFFAELDGDDALTIDRTELSDGRWFHRDEIPAGDSVLSLTWTMIEAFRENRHMDEVIVYS